MTSILGISAFYHDSAAALVVDGEIVAAAQEERWLSDCEIATLDAWVKNGKAEGDPADLPPLPVFPTDWQLGKPDLVLKMNQPFALPSSGPDTHQHFVFPLRLTENRLISAVEFRPGNPRVVHHACFYLDNKGAARKLDAADAGLGYGGGGGAGFIPHGTLRSWLPGLTPRYLPEGTGRPMVKGSDLVVELHYQCSGKPETDQSTVALYFAPRKAKQLVGELQIVNYRLNIPPGEKRHKHSASYTVPTDIVLLDCAPHMHLLGKEMKATATCPDGKVVPLVWVQDWNYLWQEQYEYAEPVRLPKGTRIDVDAWYDNSPENPLNPFSPPQRVRWGEQTKEEMGICHFQYTCDRLDDFMMTNRHYAEYRMARSLESLEPGR